MTETSHHIQLQAWTLRQIVNNIADTLQTGSEIATNSHNFHPHLHLLGRIEQLTYKFFSALDFLSLVSRPRANITAHTSIQVGRELKWDWEVGNGNSLLACQYPFEFAKDEVIEKNIEQK